MNTLMSRCWIIILLSALGVMVAGCAGKTALIYEAKGDRQCEVSGLTLQQSIDKLEHGGVSATESLCGKTTGLSVIMMCGGPTTNILIHRVSVSDVDRAKALGFEEIGKLSANSDDGYQTSLCP